ncbi:hypothetical protein CHU98_g3540 [Xylaria longipes]|nr:hypothetical protein CHU98_g3540 [Xylaria longipes]
MRNPNKAIYWSGVVVGMGFGTLFTAFGLWCKTGIWESNTTLFSGTSPVYVDPDVLDRIINGIEPSSISAYGCALDYQSFDQRGRDTESSVKSIAPLGNA